MLLRKNKHHKNRKHTNGKTPLLCANNATVAKEQLRPAAHGLVLLAPKPGGERFPPGWERHCAQSWCAALCIPRPSSWHPRPVQHPRGMAQPRARVPLRETRRVSLRPVAGVGRLALLKAALGARRCPRLPQAPASLGQSAGWAALADQVGDLRSRWEGPSVIEL